MTTTTRSRIEQLRQIALPLEPNAEQRARWREQVILYTDEFLGSLPELPAFCTTEDEGAGILDSPISEAPIPVEQALDLLKDHVDRPEGNEGTTPGYLAFIPSGGLYASALADYIAAVTNRFVGIPSCSPGAARDAHQLNAADYPRAVVYLSDQTHYSVVKGLRIAGMKACVVRHVPLDQNYRMQPEALEAAISRDRQAGLLPWLVVATAGTTNTGAVDPLASLADIARHNQLWMHVNGAYGAMFALCEMGKAILGGIEQSDSVSMDPHKGLFMALGTGAILVRNRDHLLNAFQHHAEYLEGAETASAAGELSQADLSPELTRPFRGLRLWLALKLTGVAPFRAALEEKLLLARHFYEGLQHLDGFKEIE